MVSAAHRQAPNVDKRSRSQSAGDHPRDPCRRVAFKIDSAKGPAAALLLFRAKNQICGLATVGEATDRLANVVFIQGGALCLPEQRLGLGTVEKPLEILDAHLFKGGPP